LEELMKAIVYTKYGPPDILQLKEVERPTPKVDEVLVKILAASANPLDWHRMSGAPFLARLDGGLRKPKDMRLGADIAGRVEALAEAKRALELDPLSAIMNTNVGDRLFALKQYDLAIEYFRKSLAIDPDFVPAHASLFFTYVEKSMCDRAAEELRRLNAIASWESRGNVNQAYLMAKCGRSDEARKILEENAGRLEGEYVPPTEVASAYSALREKEKAFEWLFRAYETHDAGICYISIDPSLDNLRSDPRFLELLRKIGLETVG
jgi:tetratricopeptide (TPR) repeat protein